MVNRKITTLALVVIATAAASTAATAGTARRSATELRGAGSSFVFPLVSQWKENYKRADISYNPIGSGGGIQAITNRSVDFGASDAPLTSDQFSACNGCVQIPWALSATSIPYNVPNAPYGLRMTGPVLADIYLGKITSWNDRRIRKLNPGKSLPNLHITPVFRSDSSGTTFNFTEYLSSVSKAWRKKVGKGTQVNFPAGVGARGSSGVAGTVSRTEGALTYVDIAYSKKNGLKFFKVQNRAGLFQLPGLRGIAASAATVRKIPASNELSIVNPPKAFKTAYPISTFTYVIVPTKTDRATDLRSFIKWAVTTGQAYGPKLLFYPVPKKVRARAETTLKKIHA
jgi:phosphate transport system substrate-binding protein